METLTKRKKIETEFTKLHTITEQEFKKMIAEKMERARLYSFSHKDREDRARFADL